MNPTFQQVASSQFHKQTVLKHKSSGECSSTMTSLEHNYLLNKARTDPLPFVSIFSIFTRSNLINIGKPLVHASRFSWWGHEFPQLSVTYHDTKKQKWVNKAVSLMKSKANKLILTIIVKKRKVFTVFTRSISIPHPHPPPQRKRKSENSGLLQYIG